jgi:hypothetical protein
MKPPVTLPSAINPMLTLDELDLEPEVVDAEVLVDDSDAKLDVVDVLVLVAEVGRFG